MFEHWMKTDVNRLPQVKKIGNVFTQDSGANLIGVEMVDNGAPVDLEGTVEAWIIKPDGETITEDGTIDENKAYVVLPDEAYESTGEIFIFLKLVNGTAVTTLGGVEAYVYESGEVVS